MTSEPLEFGGFPPFDPAAIDPVQQGLWRYRAMLPVVGDGCPLITLGEGWTPLVSDEWKGLPLYWKLDALMPTGSYKDRGVSAMVTWLVGLGVDTVVDDSSGNAGASLACYAGRAGLEAWIYVPSQAPLPKRAQIAVYGADLVEVPGPRENAAQAAVAATMTNKDTAYASHAWHPAFLMGQMTVAWEIWEQLGGQAPDWLIAPAGHGGTLLGAWRGFQHLSACGIVNKLPRLVAVQAAPFTPIYEAFRRGWDRVRPHAVLEESVADGIAIAFPVRHAALLAALYRSNGTVIAVEEGAVLEARTALARRGLFVEPTSAVVAAALDQLRPSLSPKDKVVAILTGHGLKNPPEVG